VLGQLPLLLEQDAELLLLKEHLIEVGQTLIGRIHDISTGDVVRAWCYCGCPFLCLFFFVLFRC
jgi:hypothetical protein